MISRTRNRGPEKQILATPPASDTRDAADRAVTPFPVAIGPVRRA